MRLRPSVWMVLVAVLARGHALRAADRPAPPAKTVSSEQVQRDLAALVEHRVIDSADYWIANVVTGGKCDGARTGDLLIALANVFKPVTTVPHAIDVLASRQIIGAPDYWTKHAVPGGTCDPVSVATVLNHVAGRLPARPPKSASAAPLPPAAIDQLKQSYDVIVAGAGTGGCGAAIQASRMGCSVLLLEETDWVGGSSACTR